MSTFRMLRDGKGQALYADFKTALELSKGRLLRNKVAHDELISGRAHANFTSPTWVPFWTRSVLAYPGAGAAFGSVLEAFDQRGIHSLLDTNEFAGLKGAALLLEDFDIRFDGAAVRIEPTGPVRIVSGFPQICRPLDAFDIDEETGVPVSKKGGVAFWRRSEGAISPIVRATYGDKQPALWANHGMSAEFAVILEEP